MTLGLQSTGCSLGVKTLLCRYKKPPSQHRHNHTHCKLSLSTCTRQSSHPPPLLHLEHSLTWLSISTLDSLSSHLGLPPTPTLRMSGVTDSMMWLRSVRWTMPSGSFMPEVTLSVKHPADSVLTNQRSRHGLTLRSFSWTGLLLVPTPLQLCSPRGYSCLMSQCKHMLVSS